jgi:hypothetical protein
MATHPALADLGIAPRLLTREQAAAYLSVSPNTFDEMVKDSRMPRPKPKCLSENKLNPVNHL